MTIFSALPGLLSGAAFGAALTAARVYQPAVIVTQLNLESWHMIQAFLTATAGSAILAALIQYTGYAKLAPRSYSSINLFGRADANVIGGAMLGCGMALSGACPGTVFPQVAQGIASGRWTLAGGLLGGIVWTSVGRAWAARRCAVAVNANGAGKPKKEGDAKSSPARPSDLTVHGSLGVTYPAALIAAELLLGFAVKMAMHFGDAQGGSSSSSSSTTTTSSADGGSWLPLLLRPVHPVVGGLLIASAQLFSLLVRRSMLGGSTAFEEAGDCLRWLLRGPGAGPKPGTGSMVFAGGAILGSFALARLAPSLLAAPLSAVVTVSPARAALGGFLAILGSRMAGGCTSGHGISGLSLLSVSSILTITSAFATGIAVSMIGL